MKAKHKQLVQGKQGCKHRFQPGISPGRKSFLSVIRVL